MSRLPRPIRFLISAAQTYRSATAPDTLTVGLTAFAAVTLAWMLGIIWGIC